MHTLRILCISLGFLSAKLFVVDRVGVGHNGSANRMDLQKKNTLGDDVLRKKNNATRIGSEVAYNSSGQNATYYHLKKITSERESNISDAVVILETFTYPSSLWGSLEFGSIPCGEYKCLFRSQSSEGEAYLVGNNYLGYQYELETQMAWKLAQYLERTYHINHLYLDSPGKVMITQSALDQFQSQVDRDRKRPIYKAGQYATVQKVHLAPEPMVTVFAREWTKFKWLYRNKVTNRTAFREAIGQNVKPSMNALKAIPQLAIDYQIMVDAQGNIYQFDLDRVFLGKVYKQEEYQEKFAKAYHYSIRLLRRMTEFASSTASHHHENDGDEGDESFEEGHVVFAGYFANTSSISCRALETVNSMSGRIGERGNVTRAAKGMVAKLVQTVLFDKDDTFDSCDL